MAVNGPAAMERAVAASRIAAAWRGHVVRRRYRHLAKLVRDAETVLADDLLRQLCPVEAEMLNDPLVRATVRLRLGGTQEPQIMYKVFVSSQLARVKYMNGRHVVAPLTEAAAQARSLMGAERYMDVVATDAYLQSKTEVLEESDVVDARDFAQLQAFRDNLPAELGGRANTWRWLHHDAQAATGRLGDFVEHVLNDFKTDFRFRIGLSDREQQVNLCLLPSLFHPPSDSCLPALC
ncbi:uncharacterized protein MONBRDRAFT_23408 [Monosiga brevicollis MX1]|uniref:Uncharacterized protein n=1 Tax=Monosiga brevicollis TaxID=81824 RepID=A9UTB2_MONBE|nr:uncharacterized protein MONBRDRAFT_23408 [Monosiga brevicollis MX1]EDQ91463.1 predicted protein [Monosiga brevicollis MX1]|eukprot:XP_001743885.1 hypothetical protein [Monosiga brevicollis MX1]